MDDRLATLWRWVLGFLGVALLVTAVMLAQQQALAVALLIGGLLMIVMAANGARLDEVSLARGGAKWRKQAVEEAQKQARAEVVPPARDLNLEPAAVRLGVPDLQIENVGLEADLRPSGDLQTKHVRRSANDALTTTDRVEATVYTQEDYREAAAFAKTPRDFARIILDAAAAERANAWEEYWATSRHIGEGKEAFHFSTDLRGLSEGDSLRAAAQAEAVAEQTSGVSPTVAAIYAALVEVLRLRASGLRSGAEANVVIFVVHSDEEGVAKDRERAAALADEYGQAEGVVGAFWRSLSLSLADEGAG